MNDKRALELEVGHCPFLISLHIHTAWCALSFIFKHTTTDLRKSAPMWKMHYIFFFSEQLRNVWANVSAIITVTSILISCLTLFLRFSVQSCNYCLYIFRRTSLKFWPSIASAALAIIFRFCCICRFDCSSWYILIL